MYCGSDINASDTVTSKWQKQSGGPAGSECGLFVLQPVTAILFENHPNDSRISGCNMVDVAKCLDTSNPCPSKNQGGIAVAVAVDLYNCAFTGKIAATIGTHGSDVSTTGPTVMVAPTMQVRRLTPTECERLQGFPDGWTAIPWKKKSADDCPDGPRYKALGNSMAVNCMEWLGERIQKFDQSSLCQLP